MFEACNNIAAASLEGSAWFRRSLAVVPQANQSVDMDESSLSDRLSTSDTPPLASSTLQLKNAQYSVQALVVMADVSVVVLIFLKLGFSWLANQISF